MKCFYLALVLAFSSSFAQADTVAVEALAAQLGMVFNTDTVTRLEKGGTARELIEEKYLLDRGLKQVDDEFEYSDYVSDIAEADGTGLGTSTPGAAQNFLLKMADQYLKFDHDGVEWTEKQILENKELIKRIVKDLRKAGAEFGFDTNGSAVCGVNYSTLYVIDVEGKQIHEYIFAMGPC